MTWNQIVNHDSVLERFKRSIAKQRLASTYLFVGRPGIGKKKFAITLAQALLCETNPEQDLEPCGGCPSCQQVHAQTHPDLLLIAKPAGKADLPLELFIGDKEHRHSTGLCHDIGLKPFKGKRRVAIIDDADFLNQEGANCLLKTLEEPPPNSLLILIGSSEQRQLSTIVSRSQVIRFQTLSTDQVRQILQENDLIQADGPSVDDLANIACGSVELAVQLSDPEAYEFRSQLISQLATGDPGQSDFAKTTLAFVDAAGKEPAAKRPRLALIADLSIEFYRQWYQQLAGTSQDHYDPATTDLLAPAISNWQHDIGSGAEIAAICIERCSEMQRQIRANAMAPNIVESWLRDLGRINRREHVRAF